MAAQEMTLRMRVALAAEAFAWAVEDATDEQLRDVAGRAARALLAAVGGKDGETQRDADQVACRMRPLDGVLLAGAHAQ